MGGRFDWKFDDDQTDDRPNRRPFASGRLWLTLILPGLLLLGGLWLAARLQLDRARDQAQVSIAHTLRLAQEACLAGDGEVFFSLQDGNTAWQAVLLRPEQFEVYCAGLAVVEVRPFGADYAVEAQTADGRARRLTFFRVMPGEAWQIPPPAAYWGEQRVLQRPDWGALAYYAADEPFAADIAARVDDIVSQTCATGACRPGARPFGLEIRPDFRQTAEPGILFVASPLLLGLDAGDRPAQAFWDALEKELAAYLTPGVIRFAVPPLLNQVIVFNNAASAFMRQNPDVVVEIVPLTSPPEEPDGMALAEFDGAAYAPPPAMITAGLVHDLSGYAPGDAEFDASDFQPQILQGAQWRGRLWFVPHAGQVRLLFYDQNAIQAAGLAVAPLAWPGEARPGDVAALNAVAAGESWSGEWIFLDTTRDALFARAFDRAECVAPCNRPLLPEDIARAVDWYRDGVDRRIMPDLAAAPAVDRARLMANWQGVPRRAALWVDDAVYYEHFLQMWPVGVAPFAGHAPLWVHGSFISSRSERPRDVWRWLVFLSHQPLHSTLRYVPARFSVAEQTRYWETLPGPLREALEAAFPSSIPVALEQRNLFSRPMLDDLAPEIELRWFGR